jgi:hypothetical protein
MTILCYVGAEMISSLSLPKFPSHVKEFETKVRELRELCL